MPHWPATFRLHSAEFCTAISRKMINAGKHEVELLCSVTETDKNEHEGGKKKRKKSTASVKPAH